MRVASWETSAGALAAFLNSTTQLYLADLFTFTLTGGGVLRYTAADLAVTVNANVFAIGPVIKRGTCKVSVGISVDTLDVTLNADASVTVGGVPLLAFIANGGLDNATLSLDRAFAAAPGSPWVGTLNLFQGRVSDTTASRYEAVLTVASASELLDTMIPRNVYSPGCLNTLFDGACGLSKAAYAVAATATSATDVTRTTFNVSGALVAGFYSLGWAVGVTGANTGVGRTIKASGVSTLTLIQPMPSPVAIGDTFTLYPGCSKTIDACQNKFGNLLRFRATPFIPDAVTVS